MNMLGSYDVFLYLAGAFVLHCILHWVYEDSFRMSSADYVAMTFFLYFGIFGAYAYYLPECKDVRNHVSLCWMTPVASEPRP